MRLWYLRRAVPWPATLGGLGGCGLLVAATVRWEGFGWFGLPMAALLAVAAAALVYDEPAVAVTTVTPRGSRWAPASRLAAGLAMLGMGLALVLTGPGTTDEGAWTLALGGLGGLVLLTAVEGSARQVPRPGGAIAPLVVLVGLAPLVLALFLEVRAPWPAPGLTGAQRGLWAVAAGIAAIGILRRMGPTSRPLRLGGTGRPAARDEVRRRSRRPGTGLTGDRDNQIATIVETARPRGN